jgi:hypothetical protein
MAADVLSRTLEFVTRTQTIAWMIRGGALALGIAILALMWTRLGKTRLTHKCIVLSVLGHLLLFVYLLLEGTDKIVGAAGWLGREGAPGIVGEHPTLLVANVQTLDGGEQQEQIDSAPKPWHITPLRSAALPVSSGPERTKVDLGAPPQRTMPRHAGARSESPTAQADPLTPRSSHGRSSTAAPADARLPAPAQETPRPPRATKEVAARLPQAFSIDMPRERVATGVPILNREMPDAVSAPRGNFGQTTGDEQRPIPAKDRALSAKAAAAHVADAGAPATSDGPPDDPGIMPRASQTGSRSSAADGPPRLLADADGQRFEPEREPAPNTSVASMAQRPHQVPKAYGQRLNSDRTAIVRQQGGSPDTEAAVKAALAWLAANQEPAGHWDGAKHGSQYERTQAGNDVRGNMRPDTGVTALALLAFLGAGHTHQGDQYQDTVRRGLDSLIHAQADDGSLAGNASLYAAMYCHGMATLALAEAYGMTGDPKLLGPVRKAVAHTLAAQSPHHGGWRYRPNDAWGDTSQFGWQVMALKAAEAAGIELPVASRHGMRRFLDYVSSGRHGGLACYLCRIQMDGTRYLDAPTPTMTAEALFCRFLLGTTPENPLCKEAADYLLQNLPAEGRSDLYYWYYGTLAMYQLQGPGWDTWNRAVQRRILNLQERGGSWSTSDRWGGHGGRVFTTALATLTLEVYYRYTPATR